MANNRDNELPGVGNIAGPDDVAPEGEVITERHVRDHQADVNTAHRNLGLPEPFPSDAS